MSCIADRAVPRRDGSRQVVRSDAVVGSGERDPREPSAFLAPRSRGAPLENNDSVTPSAPVCLSLWRHVASLSRPPRTYGTRSLAHMAQNADLDGPVYLVLGNKSLGGGRGDLPRD